MSMADVVQTHRSVAPIAQTMSVATIFRPSVVSKAASHSISSDNEINANKITSPSDSLDEYGSSSTDAGYTSCSEVAPSSDSEAGDDDSFAAACYTKVYPLTLLLQFRVLTLACTPPLRYGVRSVSECPADDTATEAEAECEVAPVQKPVVRTAKTATALAASPTSWAAQRKQRRSEEGSSSSDAEVARAARSILNKLTIERFDGLYEQLAVCGISTPAHVAILVREIFEKATTQHNFIGMYADLCARLEIDQRLSPDALSSKESVNIFRRTLLNQCQFSFEKLIEAVDESQEHKEDEDEAELRRSKRKQRALGNVKLVGQLLVRGMLSSKLLLTCCGELLSSRVQCPEALESLAALLTVTGPTFDAAPDWPNRTALEEIFGQVRDLVQHGGSSGVPSRVRFLLRDLLELRQNKWNDDKEISAQTKGPMRLDEVRESTSSDGSTPPASYGGSAPARRSTKQGRCGARTGGNQSSNNGVADVHAAGRRLGTTQHNSAGQRSSGQKSEATAQKAGRARLSTLVDTSNGPAPTPTPWRRNNNRRQPEGSAYPPVPQVIAPAVRAPPAVPVVVPPPNITWKVSADTPAPKVAFDRKVFRQELTVTLRELSTSHDVTAAVKRIRLQKVPIANQAVEFADILTRAVEESRGPARRSAFAFAAGLANGEYPAFDRDSCTQGISMFFQEVYEDLCEEVQRLPAIVSAELLPTLRAAIPAKQLNAIIPSSLQSA